MTILRLIFNKRIIYRKWYLFIFDTKITISPVSPSQDARLRLATKYLNIDILTET